MKLNAKTASTWLAVPLAALVIAACGDSGSTTPPPPVDAEPEYTDEELANMAPEPVCGDTFITHDEECEGGPTCHPDTCMENECGDNFVGPGEDCDSDTDCNDCRDPECGDGATDDGEQCDDGNSTNDDGCSNACNLPECGDGIVQTDTEECDEGSDNGNAGSPCTDSCEDNACGDGHVGPAEACDDGNDTNEDDCTNNCGLPTCGDGVVQADEACDDGNTNERDECLSSCSLNTCGDGEVFAGTEECDDGNTANADSCTNGCLTNVCGDGFVGPGEGCDEGEDNADDGDCTTLCAPKECGDGQVQAGEDCDDGNTNNSDGCSNTCVSGDCGDGIRQDEEECDDGNTSNADACSNDCANTYCGDGFEGEDEACDDGNTVDGDGCQANCALPGCGDGIKDADEECDDGNTVNSDSCLETCLWNSCGDGETYTDVSDDTNANPVEECDDGNSVDEDICTNSCANAVCGDTIVGPNESCDDGNTVDGDACNNCVLGTCGNGILDPLEPCDDGNAVNTDACTNTCAAASCGDGFVQTGVEGCDDVNTSQTDACLNTCQPATCGDGFLQIGVEDCDLGALNGPGSQCSTLCTVTNCGDGALDPGEECDDGNNNNNDSCTQVCLWNVCGDGAVYIQVTDSDNTSALEECDDFNDVESDLCLATCNYNRCSDGVLLTDEDSEPYDDPDGTGVRTASRGGVNDTYHSGPSTSVDNFEWPFLIGPSGDDDCNPGEACIPGLLDLLGDEGEIPNNSGLSDVDIEAIDEEECDDGNLTNTDACLARNEDSDPEYECRVAYCNDGEVQATVEQCDDGCGPLVDEEDCTALRDQNDSCLDTCVTNVCGDGWLYTTNTSGATQPPIETCDDGNTAAGDACTANCNLPTCGNGVIDFSIDPLTGVLDLEQCDNGGSNSNATGSTCSTDCERKNATTGALTCGNGTVDTGEECDDENDFDNDSCLSNCMFNKCGDGARYVVQTDTNGQPNPNRLEQCDDANDNDEDSCLATCVWNTCGDLAEYRKETDGNPSLGGPLSGNGLRVGAEVLIDGDVGTTSVPCNDTNIPADQNSIALYDDCNAPDTDDNFGTPSESLIPEECDDGNTVNTDTCSNQCEDAECGDGILQAGELCDDGDTDHSDCLSFDSDAEWDVEEECADECDCVGECDSGDDEEALDCYANCVDTIQSCTPNSCGDGFVNEFEACDDGNNVDTDACHNDCSLSSCGNNQLDDDNIDPELNEECEDGNSNSNDACTNVCLFARCGDGILQVVNGEECDDGNDINTDACTSSCTQPICGDGVRNQATEQCDPGRPIVNDIANEEINPFVPGNEVGSFLYPNHDDGDLEDDERFLSHEERDDGFVDEPFFCDPNTCRIRCDAQVGTNGRRWKENNNTCVFAAEPPGYLDNAQNFTLFNNSAPSGSFTIYNDQGGFDPEIDQQGWAAARAHCKSYGIGADLVVIRNTSENADFLAIVDAAEVDAGGFIHTWWWTGLNDTGTQASEPTGAWRWLDGTPTDTFRNWSGPPATPQRPDDSSSDEDCGGFASSGIGDGEPPGTWNDLVCQSNDPFFACEFAIPAAAN